MEIVERLRDMQSKKYSKEWATWVQTQCTQAADEIERLHKRCHPTKVVMIGNAGHYVSEGVAAEIDRLRAALERQRTPLQRLGDRLAELLDEDQWAECEALLLAAGVTPSK